MRYCKLGESGWVGGTYRAVVGGGGEEGAPAWVSPLHLPDRASVGGDHGWGTLSFCVEDLFGWEGGWVGEWVEEMQAVGISYCGRQEGGWVGGWVEVP